MQLKGLTRDLDELKKAKVKLMRQMKEEMAKNKKREAERERQISQLKKESRKREIQIKNMESEKRQRELVLKRKQAEVLFDLSWFMAQFSLLVLRNINTLISINENWPENFETLKYWTCIVEPIIQKAELGLRTSGFSVKLLATT